MANISKINNYDIKDATARAAIDTINHSSNGVLAQAKKYADDKVAAQARYEVITTMIDEGQTQPNGYYVLLILSVVITFASQFISVKLTQPKGQKLNTMNKVMLGLMPLLMMSMALSSNVVFTLYIIANSVMSTIITTGLTLITKPKNGKEEDVVLPRKNVEVVEYSRNYKK